MPNLKLKDQPAPPAERETDKTIAALQRRLRELRQNRAGALRVSDRDDGMEQLVARLDLEIADVNARLGDLRGGVAPEEQLAGIETEIAAAGDQLRQLNQQKTALIEAKIRKEHGAVAKLRQVEKDIGKAVEGLQGLRRQRDEVFHWIADARTDAAQQRATTTPGRAAELAEGRMALATAATAAAHTLADALRRLQANAEELAELIGGQGVNGFLSDAAFRGRFNDALARDFAIDAARPLTSANSLLGIASHAVGARSHMTIAEVEIEGLDDLCPLRVSEEAAEAARLRLEQRGDRRIVVPLAGVWMLVPFEHVFGDEIAAQRAARRAPAPMAIVGYEDGWLLVARQFCGEAK